MIERVSSAGRRIRPSDRVRRRVPGVTVLTAVITCVVASWAGGGSGLRHTVRQSATGGGRPGAVLAHVALLKSVSALRNGTRGGREELLFPTPGGGYRIAFGPFDPSQLSAVDLSSNGRWFAYVGRGGDLYLVDLWRHRRRLVGRGLLYPDFSSDGRYLAFARTGRPPGGMPKQLVIYNVRSRAEVSFRFPLGGYEWAHDRDTMMWPSVREYQGTSPGWVVEVTPSTPIQIARIRLRGCRYSCGVFNWTWSGRSVLYWQMSRRPYRYRLIRLSSDGRRHELFSGPVNCGKECSTGGPSELEISGGRILTGFARHPDRASAAWFNVICGHTLRSIGLAGFATPPGGGPWKVNRGGTAVLIPWLQYIGPANVTYKTGVAMWRAGHKEAHELGPYLNAFWIYPDTHDHDR